MFINLYKLIFLGTKFMEKVIQIPIPKVSQSKKDGAVGLNIDSSSNHSSAQETPDWNIDTSEMSSNE